MTRHHRTPPIVAALLLLALASDVFGGAFTAALNAVGAVFVAGAALALPVLVWALAMGLLHHRGPRSTR